MPPTTSGRRPLKSRDLQVFKSLASIMTRAGISPNMVSGSSMLFGALAGSSLAASRFLEGWSERSCWFLAALAIQLRLMANLLDGMIAVEGGRGGPTGDLWNEAPDRVSDTAIFVGAGFAQGSDPLLGLGAALISVFVAYVRALGASVGVGQCFLGPQAKPQRMAIMTLVCILYTFAPAGWLSNASGSITVIRLALLVVIGGGVITAWRRMRWIAGVLKKNSQS